jgi:hypothetical protein
MSDDDVSSGSPSSSPFSSSSGLLSILFSCRLLLSLTFLSESSVRPRLIDNKTSDNKKLTLYEEMMIERARHRYEDMTPENRKLMERLIVESESKKRSISFRTFQRYQEEIEAHPFKGIFWLKKQLPSKANVVIASSKVVDDSHKKDSPLILHHPSQSFATSPQLSEIPPTLSKSMLETELEMEPVHVASLFRQQISMLLARKISPFGRPPMAHDWPYKASICQVNYFPWALQNHILEHLAFAAKKDESLIRPSFLKRKRKTESRQKKKKQVEIEAETQAEVEAQDEDDDGAALKVKKRKFQDNNVYFFDYPCQVRQPTEIGEQDDRVKEAEPLVCSDSKFVENYYATLMKESLLTYEVQSLQKVLGHHLAELNHIPLLASS